MDSWYLKQCPRCGNGDIHSAWGGQECIQCGYTPSLAKKYYSPMLAKLGQAVFDDPEYLYEPKYDGIRCLAYCDRDGIKFISRSGNIITDCFPEVDLKYHAHKVVFDGELVCLDNRGVPDFQLMQTRMNRIHNIADTAAEYPATYYIFDLLSLDGWDISELELKRRKPLLHSTLIKTHNVSETPYQIERGAELYKRLEADKWEGVMAKQLNSRYLPGQRTKSWQKLKCIKEAEVVIGGATYGFGKREDTFGALVVGIDIGGRLLHCGEVGTGFTDAELARLTNIMQSISQPTSPFVDYKTRTPIKVWCNPVLRARVTYLELTNDGKLRNPAYQGLII